MKLWITAVSLMLMVAGCAQNNQATKTHTQENQSNIMENKKIAEMDVQSIGQEKLEQRLALYADDAVIWDSVIQVVDYAPSNTVSGPEAKKFLEFLAGLPPVEAKILSTFGEGNKVAVEWILSGGDGDKRFEIPCVNLYDIENGKIKGVRMQFDSYYFSQLTKQ